MTDNLRKLTLEIVEKLDRAYPEAHQELKFSTPFELLIATILAAQCTDAKVNQVTQHLFKKYRSPKNYLSVSDEELRQDLQGITFSWNKSKYVKNCCKMLIEKFSGEVPKEVADLTKLSGVGRKTANIVRANAMGIPAIGVDTHTIRVPSRLGLVSSNSPEKIEEELCRLLPEEKWHRANIVIQWHGRYTCKAKKPKCSDCVVFNLCRWQERQVQVNV